ncbi:hypothetical protein [Arcticibacterium luteifluviistationis]|uniref:Uncharacterized protein n=1 Tax=Arcticibacterium luteifluviistationis TaxID=1784714 RepID=A0A2Z4G8U8_9BACT|nr:hypothetical protein [Arcticibacterium luteifluviistationis]AWV97510.1 hypothetical protein DJ013_04745 [Arcticibacterium luteifluviistationis]
MKISKEYKFIIGFWTLLLLSIPIYRKWRANQFDNSNRIIYAQVLGCTSSIKSAIVNLRYRFYVDHKYIIGSDSDVTFYNCKRINEMKSAGIHIPILVVEKNPNINKAIFTKKEFEKYGFILPDSLAWMNELGK